MPQDIALSNPANSVAPLRNVAALMELLERVMNRTPGLPGMATFHGFSGYGKSFAAMYAANKYRAYLVQEKAPAGDPWRDGRPARLDHCGHARSGRRAALAVAPPADHR